MSHPHTEHLNRAAPGGQTHRGKQQRLWARQRRPRGRAARSMLTTNPTLLIKPDWARTSGESSACTAARLAKACPAPSATRTSRRAPHCAATSHCPAGSANSHSRSRPCGPARRLLSGQGHWLALAAPPRLPSRASSRASCQCSHHRAPARSAHPAQTARRSARQPHFNMTRRASWQHLRDDEDGAVAGRGGRLRGLRVQHCRHKPRRPARPRARRAAAAPAVRLCYTWRRGGAARPSTPALGPATVVSRTLLTAGLRRRCSNAAATGSMPVCSKALCRAALRLCLRPCAAAGAALLLNSVGVR